MPLPKIAWLRILDAVEAMPTLSIQSATLAVLLSNGETDEAQTVALKLAKAAMSIQKNMQAIRLVLMTLVVKGQADE